jgi:hypothetical protein
MKIANVSIALLLGAFTLSAAHPDSPETLPVPASAVVAHEWGTFTSVANEEGRPVAWAPWVGPNDLPCFVSRMEGIYKFQLSGLVRMETPVLYFYSTRPQTLSVKVDFPHGWITEWYPKATVTAGAQYIDGKITWDSVAVQHDARQEFPTSKGKSHYFAARNTDSAPLSVGAEQEKLLFYRGIGGFQVPLQPKFLSDGKLEIRNAGPDRIPLAIVFENRAGKIGYRLVRGIADAVTVDLPETTGDFQHLRQTLASELREFGLYQKEADAMVETWRDSWFEEGTRILYVYPRNQVDQVLPLSINPAPASLGRVFVGRVEMLSPWTKDSIQTAMKAGDVPTLAKFGRFLDPFLQQIRRTDPQAAESLKTKRFLGEAKIQNASSSSARSCVE